jgi:muramoyltetrapeptide carboxypeptidase
MNEITSPKPLKKGDKIAIISPAGAVEKEQLAAALSLIKKKGFVPVLGKNALGKFENGYNYSGTEKERLDDLNWALNSDEISAIWATRGGYGCQHLLEKINLKGFKKNPKWYIGYSDNTAIQSYLLKKGFASIHGQTLKTSSFGVCKEGYENIFKILSGNKTKYLVEGNKFNKKGKTEGVLVGGNLALIYALLGTKYSFDFKNKILFLEDIGENYYALDRMLMSLDLAGVFKKLKGLIIGGMTKMGNENDNANFESSFDEKAYEIISQRIKKYNIPTLFAFPNGHILENKPIIIGANVQLEVKEKNGVLIFK